MDDEDNNDSGQDVAEDIVNQASPTDPQENPVGTGHLPGAGEVGVGPVSYHDPMTTDTDDSVIND